MASKQEFIDEIISRKDIIETFVKYYGEDKREFITERIQDVNIICLYKDEIAYKVYAKIKEKYQDKNPNWERIANTYIGMLRNLAYGSTIVNATILAKDANVLTELGFNYKKIIRKSPEGLFEIIDGPETEKLKDFVKTSLISKKKDLFKHFNIDRELKLYNSCAEANVLAGSDSDISRYKESKDKEYETDKDKPFIKIENLDKKKKEFIFDFFTSKGPVSLWSDKQITYIVNGFNTLFNKNYTSIEDITSDPQMKLFLDFKEKIMSKSIESQINSYKNNKSHKSGEELGSYVYGSLEKKYFGAESTETAAFSALENNIYITLSDDTAIDVVLHECGHCLSKYVNNNGTKTIGYHDSSVALDEIVNEFLTQKAISNVSKEVINKSSARAKSNCGYTPAIEFMSKFLNKFEPILKKAHLSGNPIKELTNFVGEHNANLIVLIGKKMGALNFATLLPTTKEFNGNLSDLLEDYKKYPDKQEYQEFKVHLDELVLMQSFMEDMIDLYSEFEQGKITNWTKTVEKEV